MSNARTTGNSAPSGKKFLSVWYRCCHTYGRMYRNRQETRYVGQCPRCGARVAAAIGASGSERRLFEAN